MSSDAGAARLKRHASEVLCKEQECKGFGKPLGVGRCEACCADRGITFRPVKTARKLDLPTDTSEAKIEKSSPKKNETALLLDDTAQANRTFDHRDMQRNTPVSSPSKQPVHSAGASPSKNAPLHVVPSTHELQVSSAAVAVSSPSKQPVHSAGASPSKNAPLHVVPSTHELQVSSAAVAVSSPSKQPYMWPAGTHVLVCTMHKPKASPQFLHVGTVHAVVWNSKHSLFAYNIQKENSSVITKMRVLPQACSIRRGFTEHVASVLFQFHF
jgi:hypothetical protein